MRHQPRRADPLTQNPAERLHRRDNEHLDASAGVEGIEAFYEQCVANGAKILKPLDVTPWGTKDFYIEDPDGYIVCFGGRAIKRLQPIGEQERTP